MRQACGDHEALKMVQETEEVNAEHETGTAFLDLLPDTPQKFLGLYNDANPADSKTATLRNMLMVRRNYEALVSGDGACAGCGEKSVLRSIASVTEAYMRPVYHAKADRLVRQGRRTGEERRCESSRRSRQRKPSRIRAAPPGASPTSSWASAAKTTHDTATRIAAYEAKHGAITDAQIIEAIAAVLLHDAFNHKNLQPIDGRLRQRHERDGHGRAHRLQHGLRLHAADQSASLSVDELALPGRRHHRLAHGRELHRRPRPPLGRARAPGRRAARRATANVITDARVLRRSRTSTTR